MKIKILGLLAALSFFLLALGLGITLVSQDKAYYKDQLLKNKTEEVTGLDLRDLQTRMFALRDYLEKGDKGLIDSYFNSKEVAHMEDVHHLFVLKNWLMLGSGLVFIGSFALGKKRFWARDYLKMNLGLLAVFILFIAFASLNFTTAFTKFHQVFFTNNLWLLDPSKDLMIQMLPQSFFEGMALRIGLFVLGMEGVYLAALWWIARKDWSYQGH